MAINICPTPQYSPTTYLDPVKQVVYKNVMNVLLAEVFTKHNEDTQYIFEDLIDNRITEALYGDAFDLLADYVDSIQNQQYDNLPQGFDNIPEEYLNDLKIILTNNESFREWHMVNSGLFIKKDTDFNEALSEVLEDNEVNEKEFDEKIDKEEDTAKKEFDKGVNEENPYYSIGNDLKVLFSFLLKVKHTVDNKGNSQVEYERNQFGFPELNTPAYMYALLATRINGVISETELIEKLKSPDLLKNIPELQQLNTIIGLDSEEKTPFQRKLFNQLYKLFSKSEVPILNIVKLNGQNLVLTAIKGTASKIQDIAESNWDAGNFKSNEQKKLFEDNGYIVSLPQNRYKLTPEVLNHPLSTNGEIRQFLRIFGFEISDNYTPEDNLALQGLAYDVRNSFKKLFGHKNYTEDMEVLNPLRELRDGFRRIIKISEERGKPIKIKVEWSAIRKISELESKYSRIFPTIVSKNADGELQSTIINENNISRGINILNKAKTIQEVLNSSFFKDIKEKNPLFSKSSIIRFLFDEKTGEKIKGRELSLEILSGSNISGKAITYKNLTKAQKLINDFVLFFKKGKTDIMRPETSNSFFTIGLKWTDVSQITRDIPFIANEDLAIGFVSKAIVNLFKRYFRGEIERIEKAKELSQEYNFPSTFFEHTIFSFIPEEKLNKFREEVLKQKAEEEEEKKGNKKEVDEEKKKKRETEKEKFHRDFVLTVENFFNKKLSDFDATLKKENIDEYKLFPIGATVPEGFTSEEEYKKALKRSFIINNFIQNVEFSILFSGDPSLYKETVREKDGEITRESEFHKRIKGLNSTGDYSSVGENADKLVEESQLVVDKQLYGDLLGNPKNIVKEKGTIRSAVIEDPIEFSKTFKKEFELTDGQGFINPDFLHEVFKRLSIDNIYTDTVFEREALVFKKDILGEPLTKTEAARLEEIETIMAEDPTNYSVTVIKASYFGAMQNAPIDGKVFDKFSLAPLFPSLVKHHPKMKKVLLDVVKNRLDYVKFQTGTKGYVRKTTTLENLENADADILFTDQLKLQIATSNTMKETTAIPTQLLKLIYSNLFSEGKSTKQINALYQDYLKTLSNIQKIQIKRLFDDFGFLTDKKGNIAGVDYKQFSELLLREAIRRDLNYKVKKALLYDSQTKKLKGNIELDLYPEFSSLIGGIVDKTLRRYKVNGGDFVMITSALTNPLEMYSYKQGDNIVTESEIYITFTKEHRKLLKQIHPIDNQPIGTLDRLNKLLFTNKEWKEKNKKALTVILDRVPTQETNSMDVGVVKQFIDPIMGNVVMLPTEAIVKSGSDFDFDKEKVLLPYLSESGEYLREPEYYLKQIKKIKDKSWQIYNEAINEKNPEGGIAWLQEYLDTSKKLLGEHPESLKKYYYRIINLELIKEDLEKLVEKRKGNYLISKNFHDKEVVAYTSTQNKLTKKIEDLQAKIEILTQEYYKKVDKLANLPAKKAFDEMFAIGEKIKFYYRDYKKSFEYQANKVIDNYAQVLTLPEKYKYLMKPNSAKYIKSIAEDTARRNKTPYGLPSRADIFDYTSNLNVFSTFFNTKTMLAPYAKHNPIQQLLTYSGIMFNKGFKYFKTPMRVFHRFLPQDQIDAISIGDKINVSINETLTPNILKQDGSSNKINGTVDGPKDPYMAGLELSYKNVGVDVFMANILGYDQRMVSAILTHPAISNYTKSLLNGATRITANNEILGRWEIKYLPEKKKNSGNPINLSQDLKPLQGGDKWRLFKYYLETNTVPNDYYIGETPLAVLLKETPLPSIEEMENFTIPEKNIKGYAKDHQDYAKILVHEMRAFAEFLTFERMGLFYRKLSSYISFDTTKVKDLFDIVEKALLREEILQSNIISEEDLIKLERQSIVSNFNNLYTIHKIYSQIFPIITENLDQLQYIASEYMNNFELRDKQGLRKIGNNLIQDFMYAILLNYNPNLKAAYDMMFTKDFGNRLDKIKQSPYFNELSQHYPVFKSLYLNIHNREAEFETDTQTSPTDRRDKIYNIYLIKSPNITSLEEDSIIFQFENLNKKQKYIQDEFFDDEEDRIVVESKKEAFNEEVYNFVQDLFKVGLLQSGFSKSFFSFREFIPEEVYANAFQRAYSEFKNLSHNDKKVFFRNLKTSFYYNNPKFANDSKNNSAFKMKFYNFSKNNNYRIPVYDELENTVQEYIKNAMANPAKTLTFNFGGKGYSVADIYNTLNVFKGFIPENLEFEGIPEIPDVNQALHSFLNLYSSFEERNIQETEEDTSPPILENTGVSNISSSLTLNSINDFFKNEPIPENGILYNGTTEKNSNYKLTLKKESILEDKERVPTSELIKLYNTQFNTLTPFVPEEGKDYLEQIKEEYGSLAEWYAEIEDNNVSKEILEIFSSMDDTIGSTILANFQSDVAGDNRTLYEYIKRIFQHNQNIESTKATFVPKQEPEIQEEETTEQQEQSDTNNLQSNPSIETYQGQLTRELIESNPDKVFLYDSSEQEESPNAVGIYTKRDRGTNEGVKVQSENISSKGSEFAKKLTNVGNNVGLVYKGKQYVNSEHAYQTWKSGEFNQEGYNLKGGKVRGGKIGDTFNIMIDILTEKLKQHPDLIKGINERGGLNYISKSTHNVIGDNFWESTGQNKFIEALYQAAINVGIKNNTSSYFTDADFPQFKQQVDEAIQKAKDSGKTIVLPEEGLGNELKETAPELYNYLQGKLNELQTQSNLQNSFVSEEDNFGVNTETIFYSLEDLPKFNIENTEEDEINPHCDSPF